MPSPVPASGKILPPLPSPPLPLPLLTGPGLRRQLKGPASRGGAALSEPPGQGSQELPELGCRTEGAKGTGQARRNPQNVPTLWLLFLRPLGRWLGTERLGNLPKMTCLAGGGAGLKSGLRGRSRLPPAPALVLSCPAPPRPSLPGCPLGPHCSCCAYRVVLLFSPRPGPGGSTPPPPSRPGETGTGRVGHCPQP